MKTFTSDWLIQQESLHTSIVLIISILRLNLLIDDNMRLITSDRVVEMLYTRHCNEIRLVNGHTGHGLGLRNSV